MDNEETRTPPLLNLAASQPGMNEFFVMSSKTPCVIMSTDTDDQGHGLSFKISGTVENLLENICFTV